MPTLWELLKSEEERIALRKYMPRNWRPDDGTKAFVKIDTVLERLEEIEKIVRQAPRGR